jgi:hypothetical protein
VGGLRGINPPRREGQGGARAPLVNKTAERFLHKSLGVCGGCIPPGERVAENRRVGARGKAFPYGLFIIKRCCFY